MIAKLLNLLSGPDEQRNAPLWPLALARILMGLLWLYSLRWKLPPDFTSSTETSLREWLELEVEHAVLPFYGNFIESVVLPNFTLFAWLVFLAELAVGLSLLFGLFTRVGALVGLGLSLNLLVGLLEVPGEWPWAYVMMAMWHGTLLVSGAGNLFGLDGVRFRGETPSQTSSTSSSSSSSN